MTGQTKSPLIVANWSQQIKQNPAKAGFCLCQSRIRRSLGFVSQLNSFDIRAVHQLNQSQRRIVALAETAFQDAQIAAVAWVA